MTNAKTIKAGVTVTLLAGISNPLPVEWTVAKVGAKLVTLVSPGRFPQRVCRNVVALALAK